MLLIIAAVIVLLLSLVPFPSRIKDGGSLYLRPFIKNSGENPFL